MKFKQTPITSAVALALMSAVFPARAQQPPPTNQPTQPSTQTQEAVVITGIRASLQQSLDAKRNADSIVEVITAEDIGRMPDKNVADSLQRVPGVAISSASASEGGFDENDRVSCRGTSPSLAQTMINGHMVGSGDWFVLNQVGTVGRSVSYSLLPSELVRQTRVYKAAQADLVEGGISCVVDILTHRPLAFANRFTAEASAGLVYADLPDKTDPQFSGLFNFKNDAGTAGVLFQAFYQKRHLRRDGQETLGYSTIPVNSPIVLGTFGNTPHPDLAGVAFPNVVGAALFEQERERYGGLIDFQVKPHRDWTLDLSGFYSKMEATNYNRNWMLWTNRILLGTGFDAGTNTWVQAPQAPSSYTVRNNTLVSAVFPPITRPNGDPNQYAIVDQIYRPGANAETSFVDFDARWRATDRLTLTSKIGVSKGQGETPTQAVFEGDVFATGARYTMHGVDSPIETGVLAGNPANFAGTALDWIFGASPARTTDEETYAQIDGDFALDAGIFRNLKSGVRLAQHKRDTEWVAQGPNFAADPFNPANLPQWNGEIYPSNFGKGLDGDGILTNVWQLSPGVLEAWGDTYSNRDPVTRRFWPGEFELEEQNSALYGMTTFEGGRFSGNVGVRLVRTNERVKVNIAIPTNPTGNPATPNDCAPLMPCSVPGAITTSAFGAFYQQDVENDYTDVLPSANLKLNLTRTLDLRLAAARTMARPDFSALGGSVSLEDTNRTGNGGNPNLKPIRSNNFNAALEWYFAPRSLLAAGLFYMDLRSYVSFGTYQTVFRNIRTGQDETYTISAPTNSRGKIKGLELAYYQPVAGRFGVNANATIVDAYESGPQNPNTGRNDLVGASDLTYNLGAYYEDDRFGVRIDYTYRSEFFNGLDRSTAQYQDETDSLSAKFTFNITKFLALTLEGRNLNNPVLKYYAANKDQPTAFYSNGRQYYLTLRGKL